MTTVKFLDICYWSIITDIKVEQLGPFAIKMLPQFKLKIYMHKVICVCFAEFCSRMQGKKRKPSYRNLISHE